MTQSTGKLTRWLLAGILLVPLLLWAGYVVYFETWLGYAQPQRSTSLLIATYDAPGAGSDANARSGSRRERVLRLHEFEGRNYVAVNHWPRAWYSRALANPEIEVRMPGTDRFEPYQAVPLQGEELQRVEESYPVPLNFRVRTGFPPRRFLRLDPAGPADAAGTEAAPAAASSELEPAAAAAAAVESAEVDLVTESAETGGTGETSIDPAVEPAETGETAETSPAPAPEPTEEAADPESQQQ